jgi:hypothetical protein
MSGPVPDQRLMGPGGQLDRLARVRVACHRPMVGPVEPNDLRQQVRIRSIGLRPGRGVPFSVSGNR